VSVVVGVVEEWAGVPGVLACEVTAEAGGFAVPARRRWLGLGRLRWRALACFGVGDGSGFLVGRWRGEETFVVSVIAPIGP
jgi:hypothetical protein